MSEVKFLTGGKVHLRPMEPSDLPHVRKWVNDPEIRRLIGEIRPKSMPDAAKWLNGTYDDKNRVWFTVVLNDKDRVIGEAGLLRIFHPWRTADASMIIGEKDTWNKGYGTEAMRLLLNYAFGTLNLHRVAIGVFDFNETAVRFYEKCGFKREGAQRHGYYCDGRYHDVIMMSILEDEFREREAKGA